MPRICTAPSSTYQADRKAESRHLQRAGHRPVGSRRTGRQRRAPAWATSTSARNTAEFYQKNIELPFFNHYLKGKGEHKLPEAYVFETGAQSLASVRPLAAAAGASEKFSIFTPTASCRQAADESKDAFDSSSATRTGRCRPRSASRSACRSEYMTDDMRFASTRPDVLTYQTDVAGPGRDAWPGRCRRTCASSTTGDRCGLDRQGDRRLSRTTSPEERQTRARPMGGYQMHVRSEMIRGRYRNSFEKPEPFKPNEPATIKLTLQDVLHTFKKGHRVMVQVHSTWFPLIDRNPQKYVPNIFFANEMISRWRRIGCIARRNCRAGFTWVCCRRTKK